MSDPCRTLLVSRLLVGWSRTNMRKKKCRSRNTSWLKLKERELAPTFLPSHTLTPPSDTLHHTLSYIHSPQSPTFPTSPSHVINLPICSLPHLTASSPPTQASTSTPFPTGTYPHPPSSPTLLTLQRTTGEPATPRPKGKTRGEKEGNANAEHPRGKKEEEGRKRNAS